MQVLPLPMPKIGGEMEYRKKLLEELKAYFTARFIDDSDIQGDDGCETCGCGATESMSLERIRYIIDKFRKTLEGK